MRHNTLHETALTTEHTERKNSFSNTQHDTPGPAQFEVSKCW